MNHPPLRILRIAAGGDGVGRLEDGRAVFIPRTAPGDLVEPADIRLHARYARARVGRLVEAGPDRIEPPCPHYEADQCGGCQLQHLTDEAQQAVRRTIVGDALRRIGRIELPDPPLMPAPRSWAYRTRITLAVDPRGRTGFHPLERPDVCFELARCPLAEEPLNVLWAVLQSRRDAWPGGTRQIGLRLDRSGGLHAIFRSSAALDPGLARGTGLPAPVVLWWRAEHGPARRVGHAADGSAEDYPATTFEQVNPAMGDRVREHAIAQLGEVGGRHVWDLYAGIGEATVMLAQAGATVESVEADEEAVTVAQRRGPSAGVRRRAGRVEEWLPRLEAPHAVYCNPPRAGLGSAVTQQLIAAGPTTIVYVSCDPATLARDLVPLVKAGYRVGPVASFDLFPQTAHVETVARMERP